MPCSGAIPARDVQLNWPTELAVSPLDDTLHFIDDNVVLKLTHDGRVSIVAGRCQLLDMSSSISTKRQNELF